MTNKARWVLAAVAAACVGGGSYGLYAQKSAAKPRTIDPWAEQDERMSAIVRRIFRDAAKWNGLFGDRFLSPRVTPLESMKALRRRFDSLSEAEERALFGLSWNDGLSSRVSALDMSLVTRSTKNRVTVTLQVPGGAKGSFQVSVDNGGIRIAYSDQERKEKKGSVGAYTRSERVERFEQILPLPPGVDSASAKVTRQGDAVTITFARRPDALS